MEGAEYASALCQALADWVGQYRDSMPQMEQHLFSTNLKHIVLNDSIIQLSNHAVTRRRRLPSWGAIYMSFLFGPTAVRSHNGLIRAYRAVFNEADTPLPPQVEEVAEFIEDHNAEVQAAARARIRDQRRAARVAAEKARRLAAQKEAAQFAA